MLKKTIVAAATAVLLGAGTLATTATTASATYYGGGHVSGNGWYFGWGTVPRYAPYPAYRHPAPRYLPAKRQVCKPKYRTVRSWKPYQGWVSYKVYAGQVCHWQPVYRKW